MPFPILDPRLTQPMVKAYALTGKTPFQLDEIVVPVSIVQDLSTSPYTTFPKRVGLFNNAAAVVGRITALEVRLLSTDIFAELTAVRVSVALDAITLSMAGTSDQALATFQQQAFGVDLAPLGAGTGQDPLTGEISLAAIDLAAGVLGARFMQLIDPNINQLTYDFPQPIVMRPGGPRLWLLGTTTNTAMPFATVYGRLWAARG